MTAKRKNATAKRRKKKADSTESTPKELKSVLGEDPFEAFDTSWMDREQGLSIEILGHDPFKGVDMEWIAERRFEPLPPMAQREAMVATEGVKAKPVFSDSALFTEVPPPDTSDTEQLILRPVFSEAGPQFQPAPLKPLHFGRVDDITAESAPTPKATFHFPTDFRWGVAVAAHQVEGNNTNCDWWAWEQEAGHIKEEHTSGQACNWWEDAQSDFDLTGILGLSTLRLSVEWSRIEPHPGTFDDAALARYGRMLQDLRARDIEPMVTLHHFSSPLWLAEQGGWENEETIALFGRFVYRTVEALGQHCDLWCTINEPNVYSYLGYLAGVYPPGKSDLKTMMTVMRNMLTGHAAAYQAIHEIQPHARVGLAHNMRILDPANPRASRDRRVARAADHIYNQAVLTALTKGFWTSPLGFGPAWKLRHTLDWIGLNYYARDLIAPDRKQRRALLGRQLHAEDAELLDGETGEFYPYGIFRCIQRLSRLGVPIYVTENGIPDDDDDQRPRYLLTHLHQIWRAIQLSYPVMGYYHWTLADSFEWANGRTLRYGLFEADPESQVRMPRPSASLYANIIRANAISPGIIDAYAPRLRPELLPGRRVDI